jgi:hypothetical protein
MPQRQPRSAAGAQDVLTFFAEWSQSVPPELTSAVAFRRFRRTPARAASSITARS